MRTVDAHSIENLLQMCGSYHGVIAYDTVIDVIHDTPTIEPEPQWIPVTEQTLPKHNSIVVVCGEKGTWDFGTYRGHTPNNINFWNWKKNTVKEVHWWMYKEDALPMPWEGGAE